MLTKPKQAFNASVSGAQLYMHLAVSRGIFLSLPPEIPVYNSGKYQLFEAHTPPKRLYGLTAFFVPGEIQYKQWCAKLQL
jgi:hypothetical protein